MESESGGSYPIFEPKWAHCIINKEGDEVYGNVEFSEE